mmetsp:Transcript_2119/g.5354  ORF Transcript_2119/g.5354 Transcript_2119/m.5354 type:complete len:243 (+) Transcript_2119:191-919(+)
MWRDTDVLEFSHSCTGTNAQEFPKLFSILYPTSTWMQRCRYPDILTSSHSPLRTVSTGLTSALPVSSAQAFATRPSKSEWEGGSAKRFLTRTTRKIRSSQGILLSCWGVPVCSSTSPAVRDVIVGTVAPTITECARGSPVTREFERDPDAFGLGYPPFPLTTGFDIGSCEATWDLSRMACRHILVSARSSHVTLHRTMSHRLDGSLLYLRMIFWIALCSFLMGPATKSERFAMSENIPATMF